MKRQAILVVGLLITALLALRLTVGAQAAPAPAPPQQQYNTPTPGPDGRITYIVQKNDTCLRISLLTGVSVDYIRTTNRLDENCSIIENQELILGYGGPAAFTPSPGPSPTPTLILPTPTPFFGVAEVCALLYDDQNGDSLRQETEAAIPGGAISLTSASGDYSKTLNTMINADPEAYPGMCFTDVPEGDYTISAAIPDGYNPTTGVSYNLPVKAGDITYVAFGAQPGRRPSSTGGGATTGSPLLGVFGALFMLAGVGLGVYVWRMRK